MISVVIPTFNEMKNPYLKRTLDQMNTFGLEIIIVDSQSSDGTLDLIRNYDIRLIRTSTKSRAQRLNLGVQAANHELVLLHHPRSILNESFHKELLTLPQDIKWGAFTHSFDLKHPLLKFTSWYSNFIRGDIFKTYYLDHCLFIRKEALAEVFPLPEVDIFEDSIFCKKAKKFPSKRLKAPSTTSAVRFREAGVYKQSLKNQILKWCYYFNIDHKWMNKFYEDKTKLNTDYEN